MTHETDYSKATEDQINECLREIVEKLSVETLLSFGDVYSFLREEYNNEILDLWEKKYCS